MFRRAARCLNKGAQEAGGWADLQQKLTAATKQAADTASREFAKASKVAQEQAQAVQEQAQGKLGNGAKPKAPKAATDAKATGSGSGSGSAGKGEEKSMMAKVRSGLDYLRREIIDETTQARSDPYVVGKRQLLQNRAQNVKIRAAQPVKENDDATTLTVHKDSQWSKNWGKFRENNKFVQGIFGMKMKFDESENIVVRGVRSVTERVQDGMSGEDSELLVAMKTIKGLDPIFDKEKFISECETEVIPGILEAFFEGDMDILRDWCTEPAFQVLSAARESPEYAGKRISIVDVGKTDLVLAKVMENGPVLVLSSRVQVLETKVQADGSPEPGQEDAKVKAQYFVLAMTREENTTAFGLDAWRVMELGMQLEQDII